MLYLLDTVRDWFQCIFDKPFRSRQIHVYILNAGQENFPKASTLRRIVYSTYDYVAKQMPIGAVDVVIQIQPYLTLPEIGIGGYAPSANVCFIYLDQSHPQLFDSISQHLRPIVAHELMHCVRWSGPGYGFSLGEALISEGLALHFEETIRGEPPWYATALAVEDLQEAEREARINWSSRDYNHLAWFSPHASNGQRPYRGYSLGYYIVANYIKARGCTVTEIWDQPAEAF
jgi:uncharacterized protein YjaZ